MALNNTVNFQMCHSRWENTQGHLVPIMKGTYNFTANIKKEDKK